MLAANITEVTSAIPLAAVYGIGQQLPFQVVFDEPVSVLSSPRAKVNVIKADGSQALATFTGSSAGGRILNFAYTVQQGDVGVGFDVLLGSTPAPGFLVGGVLTTVSDGTAADRAVDNNPVLDPTLATLSPGVQVDGVAPQPPIVAPTVYVNPTAWQSGLWSTFHPEYFVVTGTIGAARPLDAGETLRVTVNGATYMPSVSPSGEWRVYLRSVGGVPADTPVSGTLAPWSTTDGQTYDVVAILRDAAGNTTSDTSSNEIVIDMDSPSVRQITSKTTSGTYTTGDVIDVSVQYDEPIRVMGSPTIAINVTNRFGTVARVATFTNVDPLDARIAHFSYTVQAGDQTPPTGLDYTTANAIDVGSGFIEDQAGNAAVNTLNAPPGGPAPAQQSLVAFKTILIDTESPIVAAVAGVSSTAPDGTYYLGGPVVPITVTFSEPVYVTGVPTLGLNSAVERVASYVGGSGTNTLTFNYVVQAGDDTGLQDLDVSSVSALQLNGGAIDDLAGNAAVLGVAAPGAIGSLAATKTIVIAAAPRVLQVTSPTPAGTYYAGDVVKIWVMFDKVVSVASGPNPYLSVNTQPTNATAVWSGLYVDSTGAEVANPTNILLFQYRVNPGDTTNGSYLNYTIAGITPGAGIRYTWSGAAAPGYLNANVTLPPLVSGNNNLPGAQIVISTALPAPLAPVLSLSVDTFNDVKVSPTDGITSNRSVSVSGLDTKFGTTWEYQYQYAGGVTSGWRPGGAISANGTGSFQLAAASPVATYAIGKVQVRQTSWGGIVSPVGSNAIPWTVDIAEPSLPTAASISETGGAGSGFTNNSLVTVTGIEVDGLLEYNLTYSSVTDTVTGPWLIATGTSFTLPIGTYNPATGSGVVVRQQDLAGNYSVAPPWTQLTTASGGNAITVTLDTLIAAPTIGLAADTTPGFAPYSGTPYTTDGTTSNGVVNVTGLEIQNLPAGQAGVAKWEYRINGGSWIVGGVSASPSSFTLPEGVYSAGSVEVREIDLAGNQVTVTNAVTWVVDQTAPAITGISAPAGTYGVGDTVILTVALSEGIYLSGTTPTLTLNTALNAAGGVATLLASAAGATSLKFAYTVQLGDNATILRVTSFTLNGSLIADRAGNVPLGQLVNPSVSVAGPVVIKTDLVVATPSVKFADDTTPGFSPYTGIPYTNDRFTRVGVVNVTGLEEQNTATGQTGIDKWEYRIRGGAWVSGGTTAPNGSFTLAEGVYTPGQIEVRETDRAGNIATWRNGAQWTVDKTLPQVTTVAANAGTYGPGEDVTFTVSFSEPIYLSGTTPTLSLSNGGTASLVTPVSAGVTQLQYKYTVIIGQSTSSLSITSLNLGGSLITDRAGNASSPLVAPVTLSGPIVIDAAIAAFAASPPNAPPGFGTSVATAPAYAGPVNRIQIRFNVPVRNFTLASLRLFLGSRAVSLKGATLTGTGANYTLTLPSLLTNPLGIYRLEINGTLTGVVAVNGGSPMTTSSNIYWRRT